MAQFTTIYHNEQLIQDRLGPPHSLTDIKDHCPIRGGESQDVNDQDLLASLFWGDITQLRNEEDVVFLKEVVNLNPVTQEDLTVRTREKIESFAGPNL